MMNLDQRVRRLATTLLLCAPLAAPAQDWGRILEDQVKQRANRAAQETIEKSLDAAEDAVRCVVTDQACIERARRSGQEVVLTNERGKPLPPERQLPSAQATTTEPAMDSSRGGNRAAVSDRFTSIIAQAPESTVVNGYVVNNRRVAVQQELTARPPKHDELGVLLPKGARLDYERTARQIVQYNPYWRIYQYALEAPKADLIRFFTDQGLTFNRSQGRLFFTPPAGNGEEFIDDLEGDPVEGFRIWRRPRAGVDAGAAALPSPPSP